MNNHRLILSALASLSITMNGYCDSDVNKLTSSPIASPSRSIEFSAVDYPLSDTEKRSVIASPSVTINGTTHAINYNTILRSGTRKGSGIFGLLYNANGKPLMEKDGSLFISDRNDYSSLLDVFGKIFMVSHFESRPGAMYITELAHDPNNGTLSALNTKPIDFSALGGGWVHCAGIRTPWKTHLGSEEYEPDARLVNSTTGLKKVPGDIGSDTFTPDLYYSAMGDYYEGNMSKINPYRYGFPIEISITGPDLGTAIFANNVVAVRHYAMGRTSNELSYVMPDEKTAYITDDGNMTGLYHFKADTAGNLNAGTLYAAKLTQTTEVDPSVGGSFTIEWIPLGHATDSEIKELIDSRITFSKIFDAMTPLKNDKGEFSCPKEYHAVSHGHNETEGKTYNECLILKPNMEKAAAFLETRRYAAMKGATVEFTKGEGITFNPTTKKLYLSLNDITGGMNKNHDGLRSNQEAFSADHIQLTENRCGAVYALDVNADYVATHMKPLLIGKPSSYPSDSRYAGDTCDVDNIANPDNLTVIAGYDTLIIGEDTISGHRNDLVWSYNLKDKTLTRIQTTPYGSEATSIYHYPNLNGFSYLISVVQHPYGESDFDKVPPGSAERHAYTGYLGPLPRTE